MQVLIVDSMPDFVQLLVSQILIEIVVVALGRLTLGIQPLLDVQIHIQS